jgi:hypothetical protein
MMPSIILTSDDAHPSIHPERRGAAAATCYMAPDGPVTTRRPTPIRSVDCRAAGLISGSTDRVKEQKNQGLVELRDLPRTNETRQRICALPVCVLKIVKNMTISL